MDENNFNKSEKAQSSYLIPGSILAAGVIIALAVIYGGGNTREKNVISPQAEQAAVKTATGDSARLLEIQEGDYVLGNPNAPVLFVEFGDFQCPFCGRFFSQTLPQIKEKYVKTGQVAFIWRDFAFLGQESFDSANAARCAGEQGKFWDYHDTLFLSQSGENRGAFSIANLKSFARTIGIDAQRFDECLDSGKYISEIENESALGRQLGVNGTPSSFINGRNITGAIPFNELEIIILDALDK